MNSQYDHIDKASVLIVDDDLGSLRTLSDLLTKEGFEIRGAPDGPTALMIVESERPDLILLDINMPGMDGYEVCQQLSGNEKYRQIPVLFLSAVEGEEDIARGFEAGAVDYITKPFQVEEVLARVKTHLKLSQLALNLEQEVDKRTKELEEREVILRMMKYSIDNAMDRIAWIAPDGRFIYVNNSACEEMGYTLDEVLTMGIPDVDPDFAEEKWSEHFQEVKKMGSLKLETQNKDAGGQLHDVEVVTNYVKYKETEFLCAFGRDVTELRQKERDLKRAFEEISALKNQLEQENIFLKKEMKLLHSHDEIVGNSNVIKAMLSQAEQVANQETSVLILGETGTGKELLAHAIHKMSARKERPMVIVNCASLPATLIEGELFGREKGAYTGALTKQAGRFELADKSTIFLDEIGDLPLDMQAKLLRVLQEGQFERLGSTKTIKVDVRVLAATNHDLERAVAEGRFRKDLYFRLSVFPITVPPLQERKDDIPLLVWSFVKDFSNKMGKTVESIPKKTMEALVDYQWPGNVRELRNVIERAMILHSGKSLSVQLDRQLEQEEDQPMLLQDVERDHILSTLDKTGWKVSGKNGAAEIMGLKESTLRARMKKLGIRRQGTS